MFKTHNNQEKISGGRHIKLSSQQQKHFTHLDTIISDLDLVVVEFIKEIGNLPEKAFALRTTHYQSDHACEVTPLFGSLERLNNYIASNTNDITEQYLFGFVEDDIKLGKINA